MRSTHPTAILAETCKFNTTTNEKIRNYLAKYAKYVEKLVKVNIQFLSANEKNYNFEN